MLIVSKYIHHRQLMWISANLASKLTGIAEHSMQSILLVTFTFKKIIWKKEPSFFFFFFQRIINVNATNQQDNSLDLVSICVSFPSRFEITIPCVDLVWCIV